MSDNSGDNFIDYLNKQCEKLELSKKSSAQIIGFLDTQLNRLNIPKESRDDFIDFLEEQCNNSKMSNNSLGIIIRALHFSAPIVMLVIAFFAPKFLVMMTAFSLLVSLTLFYLFKGCFLTLLESRMCNDSFTITDPILELLDMKINRHNRYKVTSYIMIIYLLIFFSIFYFRFMKK